MNSIFILCIFPPISFPIAFFFDFCNPKQIDIEPVDAVVFLHYESF